MSDMDLLAAAENNQVVTHIWNVVFHFRCTEDETNSWNFDEVTVGAGADGQVAIDKVRREVHNPEKYGCHVTGFQISGLKLLAEAELQ